MTQLWVNAGALPGARVLDYEALAELNGDDDVQRGEVGLEIDPGTGIRSSDSLIIHGAHSLAGLLSTLEQLCGTVREAMAKKAGAVPPDNPRLARILKLNRTQEALVAVLREHFTAAELGGLFDLMPDDGPGYGQPFATLVGAIGTAWAEQVGAE